MIKRTGMPINDRATDGENELKSSSIIFGFSPRLAASDFASEGFNLRSDVAIGADSEKTKRLNLEK